MQGTYEIGFIVSPEIPEEDVPGIIEIVTGFITKANGSIEKVDNWGRKKLAYPLKKHQEGYYIFLNCVADSGLIIQLERRLRQTEKILRFLVFRLDDKLKKANKLVKKWAKMEHMMKKSRELNEEEISSVEFEDNEEE